MAKRCAGIMLLLASGLLTLFLVVGAGFAGLVRLSQGTSGAGTARTLAGLAAESGMHYAAARLFCEPREPPGDWTGRLRGTRFSLEVASQGGKIPLNAGALDALDRDGGGLPDHADMELPYHRGLAQVLNNLGAILIEPGGTWRRDVPTGTPVGVGEPIRVSWLGHQLIGARPLGGYRSLDEVDRILKDLGYKKTERRRILPHLDVGPYPTADPLGRPAYGVLAGRVPYVPIELASAPREVLQALWMYLSMATKSWSSSPWLLSDVDGGPPGAPLGPVWPWLYGRSGSSLRFLDVQYRPMIWPDEAEALADRAVRVRDAGDLSWEALQRVFVEEAPQIFARDLADLVWQGDPKEVAQASWARVKAEIAFRVVSPDPYPWFRPDLTAWSARGVPFDPARPWTRPVSALDPDGFSCVPYPEPFSFAYADGNIPYEAVAPNISPQGVTLAPPVAFEVACEARREEASATARGLLRAAERLECTTQEDFEIFDPATLAALRRRGIDIAQADPAAWRVAPTGQDNLVTLPRPNARSRTPADAAPFSRDFGAIALASLDEEPGSGVDASRLCWPMGEDFDSDSATDYLSLPDIPPGPFRLPLPEVDDFGNATPWWYTFPGGAAPQFQCPGLAGNQYVTGFSVEAWLTPRFPWSGGRLILYNGIGSTDPASGSIELTASRSVDHPHQVIDFQAKLSWKPWPGGGSKQSLPTPAISTRLDEAPDPLDPFMCVVAQTHSSFHVVFTAVYNNSAAAPKTTCQLYVNGESPTGLKKTFNGWLTQSPVQKLDAQGADEIRFYDRRLSPTEVKARFEKGRYRRSGLYRSPVYDLGGTRMGQAQWTGFSSAALAGEVDMRVVARAFTDPLGQVETGSLILDEPGRTVDLAALGPARAFRYELEVLDLRAGEDPPPPLYDTPVFESVWFAFKRPGRAGRWVRWEEE